MLYTLAADLMVLFHFLFVVFALFGGLLVLKWRWLVFAHLPAAVWATLIEFMGWICPLTPLEQNLRLKAGQEGYTGGFLQHYLEPVIYPEFLTRDIQIILGFVVIALNLGIYGWVFRKLKKLN